MQFDISELDKERFSDIKFIGRGGSAHVYSAFDKETGKKIAIKCIFLNPTNKRAIIEFERETKIMAEVAHPTIVGLINYIRPSKTTRGNAFIFTELMPNGSLESVLQKAREGNAPKEWNNTTKMKILYGIAVGMNHIHNKGVIHRDLKPGNVLIDEFFNPRITDFGLSKITQISQTQSTFSGTIKWMAPEILNENSYYSFPVDVYAYAIIIYEVISGIVPFGVNKSQFNIMSDVVNNIRPTVPDNFPASYKKLMEECWNQDPNLRPTFSKIVQELAKPEYVLEGADLEKFNEYAELISAPIVVTPNLTSIIGDAPSDESDECDETFAIEKIDQIRKTARDGEGQEQIEALINLGMMLETGEMIPKDVTEAAACYKKAADKGNAVAQHKFGHMLELGIGVEKDEKAAFAYYKLSADNKNPDGIQGYACCLLNGIGGPANAKEGVRLIKESADARNAKGLFNYGLLLLHGEFIPMNAEQAKECFKASSDLGYIPALVRYGMILTKSNQFDEAFEVFTRASNSGDAAADVQLGLLMEKQNKFEEAASYYNKAAREGNSNGLLKYGFCLLNGKGVPLNKTEASNYFKKAAEQGNTQAMVTYAKMCIDGTIIKKDVEKGVDLLTKAAAKKNKEASLTLGNLYFEGTEVTRDLQKAAFYLDDKDVYTGNINVIQKLELIYSKDISKAINFYYEGVKLKDPKSTFLYGICNLRGTGIEKNVDAGLKLLNIAANSGYSLACMTLGEHYEKAGKQYLKLAYHFYKKAEELGEKKATERLRVISKSHMSVTNPKRK